MEAILDVSHVWRRIDWKPRDATVFNYEGNVCDVPSGRPLPEGAVDVHVVPGGWDHDHCGLCGTTIDLMRPEAYTDDANWLCPECHSSCAVPHDLSFQRRITGAS